MVARRPVTPELRALLATQDGVVTRAQLAAHGFDDNAVHRRVREGVWQRPLPGILTTFSGCPTRRQRLVAAWLWGGAGAAVDGADALRWYGVELNAAAESPVQIVVPSTASVRSRDFVRVRRAMCEIQIGDRGIVPYVDAPAAAVVAARNARSSPQAIAVLSRTLQQGVVTLEQLRKARARIGDKWCRPVDGALLAVGVGVRSPAEQQMCELVRTSTELPEVSWNQWLDLGDSGGPVCVDGLLSDAGLAIEVIGRKYHAWGQQYEDTNARKERLQAAGLLVCEATPLRIRTSGARVLADLEATYRHHRGRGMPPGVACIPPPGLNRR